MQAKGGLASAPGKNNDQGKISRMTRLQALIASTAIVASGAGLASAAMAAEAVAGEAPFALALQPVSDDRPQLVPDAAIARDVVALHGSELVLFRSPAAR